MNPNREPQPASSAENKPRTETADGIKPSLAQANNDSRQLGDEEQGEGYRLNNAEKNSSNTGRPGLTQTSPSAATTR